tara:strand:+ start:203 stop:982 length:780 start_codon:yes stop_codon:yes gene_type:complete
MNIRACIFDLGGTIVDRYSRTPFLSLKNAFQKRNIRIDDRLIFKDMGMHKLEHIHEILKDPYVCLDWMNEYGVIPTNGEEKEIYNDFNEIQKINTIEYMDILPETKYMIQYLQSQRIKTGVTTGFNKEIMNIVKNKLNDNKIFIDNYVSSTCLNAPSRPHPYMIYENMEQLQIKNPKSVIKIDDTQIGIMEGKNAGCITVGVYQWSTYMKVYDNYNLIGEELDYKLNESKNILSEANPDFLIKSLAELPGIIRSLNHYK